MRRIVITGMGAISALGHNAGANWEMLRAGRSAIGPIQAVPRESLKAPIAAEVRDFNPCNHFDEKRLILLDRVSQFALIAAREAIAQSGLDFKREAIGERTAVILGTGIGGESTHDEASRRLYGENSTRIHPMTIVRTMANAPACQVSMEFGLTGPAFAVVSACASSNHAMAQAFHMLRSGQVDFAISGGTEACITYGTLKAWEAMRVLADDTCRPFCKQRRGLVLGEGAGVFVFETLEHAQARGARILAEFAGTGMSADAADIVCPAQTGAARTMQRALQDAGLNVDDIDYINAHGTGTPINDRTESAAIEQVFGDHARKLAISSTKSMHGHALGAAGALELIAVIGSLLHNLIPPTANFVDPDPQCSLDYVPNVARSGKVRSALSNSFAFGGLNAVIALRKAP